MNAADTRLRHARSVARRRVFARAMLAATPWLLVAIALAWRTQAAVWSMLLIAAALGGAGWLAWRSVRGIDDPWLARALDARRSDMEDSAELLFPHRAPRNALERLQQARLRGRVAHAPAPDLRPPWRIRRLLPGVTLAGACIAAILFYPAISRTPLSPATPPPLARATAERPPRLVSQRVDIRPPDYTQLPARSVEALAAKFPEGSALHWALRFAPMPARVELVFHDGERLALQQEGDTWTGSRRFDESALYRIETEQPLPAAQAGQHRLEVIADRPPRLRALQPEQTLTLLTPGQRSWALEFEASDDYGLAPSARLRITRTEGSGENITTRQQLVTLRGQGNTTSKRYRHRIDLAALGLVAGDDLIARLEVSDRAPTPHTTRSPSFILRWKPEPVLESTDLDGMVKRVMPAYFRSQRQIIIDAEALLKERPSLAADTYLERSDAIGVDQRLLRLRYGQFLGEESEGAPKILPTNDAQAEHDERDSPPSAVGNADATLSAPGAEHDDHAEAPGTQRQPTFGEEQAVLEQFGHTHDHAEAATLLDPGTRKLLKAALDEMWQSELNLRQGRPDLALPYAHRALDYIKQVQQAERIYLPRVGTQLPPIDPGRRLGGDRAGLGDRRDLLERATADDPVVADAWRALAPVATAGTSEPDLDALAEWIDTHDTGDSDPLELAAAIDALRREPDCGACRARLRGLLWPLLAHPPAATGERESAGRTGEAYLDALREVTP